MKKRGSRILKILSALTIIGLLLLAYSYFIEPRSLLVTQQDLAINGWDPALDGFKIVAIGDIHGGSNAVDEAKLKQIIELTNEQNPDLIVLLGDYVSQRSYWSKLGDHDLKMPLQTITENLAGLKAKYGVVAVMGNHDDWYGNGEITNAIRGIGYTVLDNEIYTVDAGGGHRIRILGLRDQLHVLNWRQFSDGLKQVIQKDGGAGPIITLEHSPDVLPIITGDLSISPDLKLMLAAHTHGGQVWLPLIGSPVVPSSYGQKYVYGHVQENGVDMFVTSGIGTSILPFRFMRPPEIAVLTIRSPNGEK
jgi:predicted MPP superfamily phosphohydrolase